MGLPFFARKMWVENFKNNFSITENTLIIAVLRLGIFLGKGIRIVTALFRLLKIQYKTDHPILK